MQFQLRDLLWATSLVAIGLGCIHACELWHIHHHYILRYGYHSPLGTYMILGTYVGYGLIGAGILKPFKLWWIGAILGPLIGWYLLRFL